MVDREFNRVSLVLLLIVLIGGGLIFRLFQKQILQYDYYRALAQEQHQTIQKLPAHRGKIYAQSRYGGRSILATNQTFYSLLVVPRQVPDKRGLAAKLSRFIDLPEKEIFEKIDNNQPYLPPLVKKLDYRKAQAIANLDLRGVYLNADDYRLYPEGPLTCYLTGYTNSEKEGQYGVEQYYDQILKGDLGIIKAQKDVYGRYINIFDKKEPKDGQDLILTVDLTLQDKARQIIKEAVAQYGAQSGSIIILDPHNGGILAMVNSQSYDPNQYYKIAEKRGMGVFIDPNLSTVYEPGSIMKPITMAAALDEGVVTPSTAHYFGASVKVDDEIIWNSVRKPFGRETMVNILENSDNVGIVWVQQKLGRVKFYNYLKKFGFGLMTGVDLKGEAVGRLLSQSEARKVDLASNAFGQAISITPLQMITAFTAFTNGGRLVQPRVLAERIDPATKKETKTEVKESDPVIKPEIAKEITDMLVSVVDHGYANLAQIPGYRVAGKTGTAQVAVANGYSETKTIHSFIGYAPADDPAFLMLVKLDYPTAVRWASESTAPIWAKMAKFIFNYYQIPPER